MKITIMNYFSSPIGRVFFSRERLVINYIRYLNNFIEVIDEKAKTFACTIHYRKGSKFYLVLFRYLL